MIIGVGGVSQSGKDTVAALLVKEYGYERRAFADPLKKHIAGLLNIPFSDIEKYKNDDSVRVLLVRANDLDGIQYDDVITDLSFREFLQRDGTEGHRDVPEMGDDFWVDLTLPVQGYYVERNIVLSDCRFANEARRIHQLGGVVVEVQRPGAAPKGSHRSELLEYGEPDYTIFNNAGIDELKTGVEIMFEFFDRIKVGD